MGRFVRSRRTVRGLIAQWQSAASLHFLEDCRVEEVQFAVAQVLDSFTQVLRKHMSVRGRVGWLCGRMGLVGDGEPGRTVSVENRSVVRCSPRSRPIPTNLGKQLRAVPMRPHRRGGVLSNTTEYQPQRAPTKRGRRARVKSPLVRVATVTDRTMRRLEIPEDMQSRLAV